MLGYRSSTTAFGECTRSNPADQCVNSTAFRSHDAACAQAMPTACARHLFTCVFSRPSSKQIHGGPVCASAVISRSTPFLQTQAFGAVSTAGIRRQRCVSGAGTLWQHFPPATYGSSTQSSSEILLPAIGCLDWGEGSNLGRTARAVVRSS